MGATYTDASATSAFVGAIPRYRMGATLKRSRPTLQSPLARRSTFQ